MAARRLKQAAYAAGWWRLALAVRAWPGVCVLGYHAIRDGETAPATMVFSGLHVPAARLDEELAALRRLATPLTGRQLGRVLSGAEPAPPRAVHVTFDDGYRSVATRALPLLERHDVPASLFICTRPVARRELFWYDAVARECGPEEVERLRRVSSSAWPGVVEGWRRPVPDGDELAPLSADEVSGLARHPLIDIGGHTDTHPRLASLDSAAQQDEIDRSLATLEDWTGRRPTSFAHPTGRPGEDYDARTIEALRHAGVTMAFTTEPGWADRSRPPLEQPRHVVADGVDGVELAYRLAWGWRR